MNLNSVDAVVSPVDHQMSGPQPDCLLIACV